MRFRFMPLPLLLLLVAGLLDLVVGRFTQRI
jgi:hypothetical protein